MGKVRIVVDSTSDLPKDVRERLGIEMVPLKVHFGNETFLDSVTLASSDFFVKLAGTKEMPTTSQPSPVDFVDVYKKLLEEPGTVIISIHLSSAFSGTYQSAVLAKSLLGGDPNIHIVDSKSASLGFGMLAIAAAEAAANGADVEAILARIRSLKEQTQLYFLVDTLEYLHRNGRIGKASAVFGSLLNIKPILSIDPEEGVIFPVDKVRGSRKAMGRIVELLQEKFDGKSIDVMFVHANARAGAEEFEGVLKERFDVKDVSYFELGPVIGTHVGPGTLGLFVTPAEA
ncbi:DegV family protein [Paenibacillus antri]|uniref:DegV family protein n=1 Tax=Paenibacillus antri TaxID=2582848 RepID=A0A5R9G4E6_9BACL|nr:DegV family protein [Paenibacillus antri]TLS49909.1 DegV family protein [Paenibacillus antri]